MFNHYGHGRGSVCALCYYIYARSKRHLAFCEHLSQPQLYIRLTAMKRNTTFVTCDAGGSTTEVCVYNVVRPTPQLQLREVNVADCVGCISISYYSCSDCYMLHTQTGGLFVTEAAKGHHFTKADGVKICRC